MGWVTAMQTACSFATVDKPYTAIISAEFPLEMPGRVYPGAFTIKNHEDFLWKGAALTLGEAASVTIVESTTPVCSVFKSNSRLADVCCVPLIKAERFLDSARLLPRLIDECFVAHIPTMTSGSYRDAQDVLVKYIRDNGAPEIVLPHTVSQTGPTRAAKNILAEGVICNCFELFGNISTSSIPVGYEYFDCGTDSVTHVVGWVSAAGMSHCVFRLS
ncbi:MAG TPA: hypothetical protein VK456_10395 [Xanthobacteraceae bacterium]|nr:hypothetical protein [Xanthobacteraceae bacterium]